MAELDRRLRLAVGPARVNGDAAGGPDTPEPVATEHAEPGVLPEPDIAMETVAPPEETAAREPGNPPGMDEDGSPADRDAEALPPVEELAKRLRPEILAALDELFRAKWTGVRRLRPGDLKTGH